MSASLSWQMGKNVRDETFKSYSNGKKDVEQMKEWEKLHHDGKNSYRKSQRSSKLFCIGRGSTDIINSGGTNQHVTSGQDC